MKQIVVATNNEGKLKEIKQILEGFNLVSMKEVNCAIDIEENGETFEENAIIKAKAVYEATGMPCITDDSGIEIEEYNGWPGVHTARFLGADKATNAYSEERNNYILEKMKGLPKEKRKVKHVTCIAYINELGEIVVERGEEDGYITEVPRGENGFGFDPIFELKTGKTLAQQTDEEKNVGSSRKRALEKIRKIIK